MGKVSRADNFALGEQKVSKRNWKPSKQFGDGGFWAKTRIWNFWGRTLQRFIGDGPSLL